MGSPAIFQGTFTKLIPSQLNIGGAVFQLTGTNDPTSVATNAPAGSLYFRTSTGTIYRKTDAGTTTNWVLLSATAAISNTAAATLTPNNFGTPSASSWTQRRIGDTAVFSGYFISGTPTAAIASISLPTGLTIDATKMATGTNQQAVGLATFIRTSTGTADQHVAFYDGSDTTKIYLAFQTGSPSGQFQKVNGNVLVSAGQGYAVQFSVPISGWSASDILPVDQVSARYTGSATGISGTLATVVWTTKDYDTKNAMSAGVFTVPAGCDGKYQINANVQITGAIALNSSVVMQIQQNGSSKSEFQTFAGGAQTAQNGQISDILNCAAGDTIRVQLSSTATLPTISSTATRVFFSICRIGT